MLNEPAERRRGGCALALFLIGVCTLSFIGAWVVTATVWGWVF